MIVRPFPCNICGKKFRRMQHQRDHIFTHSKMKPHMCGLCRKGFCQEKNIKLKPSKFVISTEVEFGGCIISRETMTDSVFIEPKHNRITAFEELKKPTTKRELQVFAGMISSLQSWYPSLLLVIPNIRRA